MNYDKGKSPIIKGLMPGLTERGKIKIGMKGEVRQGQNGAWQLPKKLDHFIVTTLERDVNNNFKLDSAIMTMLGADPRRIPVLLLFDDISLNFQCRYSLFNGKTLYCSGDGEYAFEIGADKKRLEKTCPCYRQDPTFNGDKNDGKGKCKINGTLSVLIDGANCVGGIWKFRTTGYNSTVGILSSLTLIKSLTGGILAGIPLVMTIQPKVATNPIDNSAVTIYVVGVEFAGNISDLQHGALKIAQQNADFRMRLQYVEEEARRLIGVDKETVDQAGDITDEFHPEQPETQQIATPEAQKPPVAQQSENPKDSPTSTAPLTEPTKPAKGRKKTAPPALAVQEAHAPTPPLQEPPPPPLQVPEGMDTNLFDLGEDE